MPVPPQIRSFWTDFLSETNQDSDTPIYDVFHFDDNESDADELVALVLQGKKQATTSLLWQYESEKMRPPRMGDLSIVTDWNGFPHCVIETVEATVLPYKDVDEEYAAAEGEGDLSLEYWQDVHWAYFGRVCKEIGRERSPGMLVACERFSVVFLAIKN